MFLLMIIRCTQDMRLSSTHLLHRPSRHPIGTRAAATCCTPLSVASKLNCAAAFLVSWTSILIPRSLICRLVSGLRGKIVRPVPKIRRSGFGHARSSTPQACLSTSHCPLLFCSFPPMLITPLSSSPAAPEPIVPSFLPALTHGRHLNASPPKSSTPDPVTFRPLLSAKPSFMHESMAVVGAGVLPSTFNAPKSVCVSSLLVGPRSFVFGAGGRRRGEVKCKQRA